MFVPNFEARRIPMATLSLLTLFQLLYCVCSGVILSTHLEVSPLADPPSAGGCGSHDWQIQWNARQREQTALMTDTAAAVDYNPSQPLTPTECQRFASTARVIIWRCRDTGTQTSSFEYIYF